MSTTHFKDMSVFTDSGDRDTVEHPNRDMGPSADHRSGTSYLPERYSIKSNGDERVLICLEAPNLNVHIEPGLAINASMARKSPAGTIFLDGVAQCEPFMDHERQEIPVVGGGIADQDGEFFAAIREGRKALTSCSACLPVMGIIDRVQAAMEGGKSSGAPSLTVPVDR